MLCTVNSAKHCWIRKYCTWAVLQCSLHLYINYILLKLEMLESYSYSTTTVGYLIVGSFRIHTPCCIGLSLFCHIFFFLYNNFFLTYFPQKAHNLAIFLIIKSFFFGILHSMWLMYDCLYTCWFIRTRVWLNSNHWSLVLITQTAAGRKRKALVDNTT